MSDTASNPKWQVDPRKLTLLCAVFALALGGSALGLALTNSSAGPKAAGVIEVDATASQKGKPDTLSLQLSVTTKSSAAAKALNQNNVEMMHLQAIFKKDGVATTDLQTNGLNVGPTYDQKGNPNGYSAEDDLGVTLHHIAKAGKIIDDAENAVGNDVSIGSISFSISNNGALLKSTRLLAMKDAHQKAMDFAQGGGEHLGAIEKISLVSATTPSPTPLFNAAAGVAKSATAVPVQAGTQSVSVEVDVTYQLVS